MAKEEYLKYLDELHKSGEVNMLGAAPYLMKEFDQDRKDAKAVLIHRMKTFAERHPK
jgi:hypothetical protein